MKLTKKELNEIIASHGKWLRSEEGGKRAALSGADLSCAYLRGADLRGADLSNADLSNANLSNANLSNAALRGADLDDYIVQVVRIGSRKGTTTYNATADTVLCGCWNNYKGGTLAEFEQRIENVYGNDSKDANEQYYAEYMAAIAFFKNIRKNNR